MPGRPLNVRIAVAAAEIATFLERQGVTNFDFILPGSVTARPGTPADFALATPPSVQRGDMAIVVEAKVRDGHWDEFEEILPKMFNIIGAGGRGDVHLYTCATPPFAVEDQSGVPQVFTLIVRSA